ncbi:MAG: membrane-bound lytic murein transglycosylase MltF [Pseudomonadota bacterium]
MPWSKSALWSVGVALVSLSLLTTVRQPPPLLDQILEIGELRVVTRHAPTTYYIGRSGPTGPEYDLMRGFADVLGVRLIMQPLPSVADLLPAVVAGQAHIAAAGLSITEERLDQVRFSLPYQQVEQHLIYRRGSNKPTSLNDLDKGDIVVMAGSSHAETLTALAESVPDIAWRESTTMESAELLAAVADGQIAYTVADSSDFNVNRQYLPELRIGLDLEVADSIAWAVAGKRDLSLIDRVNEYFQEIRRDGQLTQILDRYYSHNDEFDYVGTRAFIRHYDSRLPRFRELFESAADANDLDWQLLAAMGYQESHWRPGAVSPTGVRGIMMLTEATADYLKIDNREDPGQSISGGARFLSRLKERVGDDVPEPDRTWMALAAYNVGYFHLKDARLIVQRQDGDPNRWVDVRDALPLLAKRQWYETLEYGYARGWEPVDYVDNIRNYHAILRWLENQQPTNDPAGSPPDAASTAD